MTDAELFSDRIYFTPEERRAFLRGVEWARNGKYTYCPECGYGHDERIEKECYLDKIFEKPYGY